MNDLSWLTEPQDNYWPLIEPHTAPLADEEQAALVRDALTANVIDRAARRAARKTAHGQTATEQWNALDNDLEVGLAQSEFKKAVRIATAHGYFFPSGPSYTVEELDEELNR